jgi:hypothetical protein
MSLKERPRDQWSEYDGLLGIRASVCDHHQILLPLEVMREIQHFPRLRVGFGSGSAGLFLDLQLSLSEGDGTYSNIPGHL